MLDKKTNYIVSGLERSGTSLMMQMLHFGGLPVAYDNSREADEHNPRGYYELEGGKIINGLRDETFNLQPYQGHIIKVTAYGLKFLPISKYRVIYMTRNTDEVLKSMGKMGADVDKEKDISLINKLNRFSLDLMRKREDMDYITINYRDLIDHSRNEMQKVSSFFSEMLNMETAIKAVEPCLYRNKASERIMVNDTSDNLIKIILVLVKYLKLSYGVNSINTSTLLPSKKY